VSPDVHPLLDASGVVVLSGSLRVTSFSPNSEGHLGPDPAAESDYFGSAKATYTPPEGALGSFPPPAAITTNWRLFTSYVRGVALPENGSLVSHSNSPVYLSNARNFLSKLVAPMNTRPPAVTIGPP
jgi:hypothetical protein